MTTTVKGLDAILSGGTTFITFEDGKPLTLLFIDWYEDLMAIREHYEPSLNPKYIRCPGKDVCPLCQANPEKYPSLKIKYRVYDPSDNKVKLVSMAKTHIQKLNTEFNLDEIDPRKQFVTIYRTGKGASDTSYSARRYMTDPSRNLPELVIPNIAELDMPDISGHITPHTPEQIQGIMNALLAGAQQQFQGQQYGGQQFQGQGQFQQNFQGQQQFQQSQGQPQQGGQFNQQTQGQFQQEQQGQQFSQGQQFNQPPVDQGQFNQGQGQFQQNQGSPMNGFQGQQGQQGQQGGARKLPF